MSGLRQGWGPADLPHPPGSWFWGSESGNRGSNTISAWKIWGSLGRTPFLQPLPHPRSLGPPLLRSPTFSLSASGAVHFTGSFPVSCVEEASLVSPKSLTFAMLSSETRTFLAARSRWTKLLASRYSMASQTSLVGVGGRMGLVRWPQNAGGCRSGRWARPTLGASPHTYKENFSRQSAPRTDRPRDRR